MNKTNNQLKISALVVAFVLGGCVSAPEISVEPIEPVTQTNATNGEAFGLEDSDDVNAVTLEDDTSNQGIGLANEETVIELPTVFYFGLDQSIVKLEYSEALQAHARDLVNNPSKNIVLAGHCDERGTSGYNLALGERRANAVARFLRLNGVRASQIEVVSYGEIMPAVFGSNEAAWGENRRVELKYQ